VAGGALVAAEGSEVVGDDTSFIGTGAGVCCAGAEGFCAGARGCCAAGARATPASGVVATEVRALTPCGSEVGRLSAMRRRRFFRVTSLTLLILFLAMWAWGCFFLEACTIQGPQRLYWLKVDHRGIQLEWANVTGYQTFHHGRVGTHSDPLRDIEAFRLLGFLFYTQPSASGFRIPMWLPALLAGGMTAWAWPERRGDSERGFAVEQGAEPVREESRLA
jgi:hypothetical protein